MHVQVKFGSDANGNAQWMQHITDVVESGLARFRDQLTGVQVFISDENSRSKAGGTDKRCLIEVRLAGMQPIAVRTHAATYEAAVSENVDKMERTLEHRLGRLEDKGARIPFGGIVVPETPESPEMN